MPMLYSPLIGQSVRIGVRPRIALKGSHLQVIPESVSVCIGDSCGSVPAVVFFSVGEGVLIGVELMVLDLRVVPL